MEMNIFHFTTSIAIDQQISSRVVDPDNFANIKCNNCDCPEYAYVSETGWVLLVPNLLCHRARV